MRVFESGEHVLGVRYQLVPGGRQMDGTAGALQKADAGFLLQQSQLLRDG
ncbi:hypothetical protein [Streptomyces sp. NPDC056128]